MMPRVCLQFVIVVFPDHTHLLFLCPHPSLTIQNKINYLPASGKVCRLLISFANSLDPDQVRQNVVPDLGPSCFPEIIF